MPKKKGKKKSLFEKLDRVNDDADARPSKN
jgi:hypothetical protein